MSDKNLTDTLILNGERVATEDMKRFWKERPDPDFSEKHNEEVIARSIKRAEKHRLEMQKLQKEGLAERVSALTSFVQYQKQGGMKNAEGYFGRKELAHLQGKKVIQILKGRKANGQPMWDVINADDKPRGYK